MPEWKIAAYFGWLSILGGHIWKTGKKIQWKFYSWIIKFFLSIKKVPSINCLILKDEFKCTRYTNQWVEFVLIHLSAVAQTNTSNEMYWRKRCTWCESDTYVALLMHINSNSYLMNKKLVKTRRLLLHSIKAKESSRCAGVQQRKEEEESNIFEANHTLVKVNLFIYNRWLSYLHTKFYLKMR